MRPETLGLDDLNLFGAFAGVAPSEHQPQLDGARLSVATATVRDMPMKVADVIRLLEADGWALKRVTGSHRHYAHPSKPGLVTVAGKPSATLKPGTQWSILKQAGLNRPRRLP